MFLVGLTGGIATGKSTVARMLADQGCVILDADVIAREVVKPGRQAWRKIKAHFGSAVVNEDGTLNRTKLGDIVFTDEAKRKVLNSITHPLIYKAMMWSVLTHFLKGCQFVVLDLPLLFETKKMLPYMSYVMVVASDSGLQLERLKSRNNLTETEALHRINAQLPLAEKCQQATHVIDNSGSVDNTRHQVEKLYKELRRSRKHWWLRGLVLTVVVGLTVVLYKIFVWFI